MPSRASFRQSYKFKAEHTQRLHNKLLIKLVHQSIMMMLCKCFKRKQMPAAIRGLIRRGFPVYLSL
jgi:hypothetical protein